MDTNLYDTLADTLHVGRSAGKDSIAAIALYKIKALQVELGRALQRRFSAVAALARIEAALGWGDQGPCEMLDPAAIAERAVEVIKKHGEASDPDLDRIKREHEVAHAALERLRTRCWSLDPSPNAIADQAIKELTRLRKIEAEPPKCPCCGGTGVVTLCAGGKFPCAVCADKTPTPEPPEKAVYEWRGNELSRDGEIVGDIRLLQHTPFRVGWKAFSLEMWVSVSGQAESIPLAKAAVEAVVRAHYGDEPSSTGAQHG